MNYMSYAEKISAVLVCGLLAGCAGTPAAVDDTYADDALRNTDLDVMFATKFPVASEEEAIAKAVEAYRAGDVNEALFFYVRALQFNPENVDLLVLIGDIHMKHNDLARAKRAYSRARAIDPEHSRSLEALGLIHMSEGNDDAAVAVLSDAAAIDDRRWRAHNALGVYLDKSGDYTSAQSHYDRALATNPAAGQVLNNRGYSKYLAGDIGGATIDLYTAAFEKGFELAWGNLGMVYASQGLYDDAISAYREIMNEANTYNNIGQIAIDNGDLDVARFYLVEAVRLSPTYFPQAEKNLKLLQTMHSAR